MLIVGRLWAFFDRDDGSVPRLTALSARCSIPPGNRTGARGPSIHRGLWKSTSRLEEATKSVREE